MTKGLLVSIGQNIITSNGVKIPIMTRNIDWVESTFANAAPTSTEKLIA